MAPSRSSRGRKPSSSERTQRTIKISRELDKKLRHYAVDNGREYSQVIEEALESFLRNYTFTSQMHEPADQLKESAKAQGDSPFP